MKLFSGMLLIILCLSCLFAQDIKKNIAVLDLDPTGIAPADAQFLTDRLRTEIFETGAFRVVERDKMNAILNEQGFQRTGCTTVECAVEIGQLLNVKNIIAGSIGKIEELYSISLRMIDVQTGMIVKTATQDYRGKLSDVLTKVIPEIAATLASEQKTEKKADQPQIKGSIDKEKTLKKIGITLKTGYAFLGYTSDANNSIKKATTDEVHLSDYTNHRNLVLEISYFVSSRWQAKMNLGFEQMLDYWKHEEYFRHIASTIENFEHRFKFTNLGFGLNYYLLKRPAKFDWYVGADIGAIELSEHVSTSAVQNIIFDKEFKYNTFAFKLATGCGYFVLKSLRLGLEFVIQATGTFDLSKQQVLPDGYNLSIPDDFKEDIMLLKKINGSGLQTTLTFGYYF